MQSILNLKFRFGIDDIAVLIGVRNGRTITGMGKA